MRPMQKGGVACVTDCIFFLQSPKSIKTLENAGKVKSDSGNSEHLPYFFLEACYTWEPYLLPRFWVNLENFLADSKDTSTAKWTATTAISTWL